MNELAHWIINIGTGAMIGIWIVSIGYLAARVLEALPDDFSVPFFTPLWNKMMTAVHRALGH